MNREPIAVSGAYKPIVSLTSKIFFLLVLMPVSNSALGQALDLKFEVKANYRDSQQSIFPSPPFLQANGVPVGDGTAIVETVDEGGNGEISLVSLAGKWQLSDALLLQFKIDAVDRYDRNPTSTDDEIDLDAFFLRYGDNLGATRIPSNDSFYAQIGKFKKFEQQRERRTESYGIVQTAFNRFEDSGLEAGFDLVSGFYGRISYTTGNPVFIRDANALAGDNGTIDFASQPNGVAELGTGLVTLYDAEVEDFDLSSDPELGLGLGYRWNSANQAQRFDILAYYYERDLAETRSLTGSFLGGDLDLFDLSEIPGAEGIGLPVEGNEKTEFGVSAWYYAGNFAFFGQYVDQDLANLDRDGFELEFSYVFDSKFTITPVVRYSELNNNFVSTQGFPLPSLMWDWRKVDYGINIDFSDNVRLIVEYTDNEIFRAGRYESQDEFLVTLRWQTNFKR